MLNCLKGSNRHPPDYAMWLSGGENHEKWYKLRFRPGQLIERGRGTLTGRSRARCWLRSSRPSLRTARGIGSNRYVQASDSHLRWWMTSGDGARLAKGCRYHCCDGSAADCSELKKGKGIHFEKFREITQEELNVKVPAWAFGRQCNKVMSVFLKGRGAQAEPRGAAPELPWREPGEQEESEDEKSDSGGKSDLRKKLQEARDAVKKLEKRMAKGAKKDDKKGTRKSADRKRKKSPAKGGEEKKRSCKRSRSRGRRRRRRSSSRRRKKRQSSSASSSRRSSSPAQGESCLAEMEVVVKLAARKVTVIEGRLVVEKPLTSRRTLTRDRSLSGTPLQIQRP